MSHRSGSCSWGQLGSGTNLPKSHYCNSGDDTNAFIHTATLVDTSHLSDVRFVHVDVAGDHVVAIGNDGYAYAWGNAEKIGVTDPNVAIPKKESPPALPGGQAVAFDSSHGPMNTSFKVPRPTRIFPTRKAVDAAVSSSGTCIVPADTRIPECVGTNKHGMLGRGKEEQVLGSDSSYAPIDASTL